MPPFVPLADGAQVEVIMALGGVSVENRLWFRCRQPPIDQTQLNNLSAGVASWHLGQVLPFLSSDLLHIKVEATDWTSFPAPFLSIFLTGSPGGNSSGSHSANVAVRVAFKGDSSQTFPNNSNFVPGIPKDEVTLNRYSDTIRDALFDAYANLQDLSAVMGPFPAWEWIITSRQLDNAWRSTQATARQDFTLFPSPYVSPRRRRLP